MKASRMLLSVLLAGATLLVLRCLPALSTEPDIWMISGPDSVAAGAQGQYNCLASTPSGGVQLYYQWTCSAGTFADERIQLVTWTAPAAAGTETLSVTARNDQGQYDTRTRIVFVVP
jgi:hypothetical protein